MNLRLKCAIILLFCVVWLSSGESAPGAPSNPTIGLWLARDMCLLDRYNADPTDNNRLRLERLGVKPGKDPVLSVYLHMAEPPTGNLLSHLESRVEKLYLHTWIPPVGIHPTGYLIARVKYSEIRRLIEDKLVDRITAGYRRLQPLNDQAAIYTGSAAAWELEPPLTGEGVRLAILDSGFQLESV